MSSHTAAVNFYDLNAVTHAARYGSARFEDVHADTLAYLPALPARVLDVGAGMGRDAAALADRGYEVTAVEPSHELQSWGRSHYRDRVIEWLDDSLPELHALQSAGRRFDFILCSAVLIHVRSRDLTQSFVSMARLLAPDGHLAISVRNRRNRDSADIFFNHSDADIRAAAAAADLALVGQFLSTDKLGRSELTWRSSIFRK